MRIGIVGGGPTGLTAGYELIKKGHDVIVYEKENATGGLVETVNVKGQPLERFYHHIFNHDSSVAGLIGELGLSTGLKWYAPGNAIYINEKLYPFTSPLDLLKFSELKFFERIAMGFLVYRAKYCSNWHGFEKLSAGDWIVKYAGKNVYNKVWKPLLKSKFGVDADRVSAVWIWNKLKLRGSTRDKSLSHEMLGYLDGSFELIYKRLAEKIIERGGKIVTGTKVDKVNSGQGGKVELKYGNRVNNFDAVIVTTSPQIFTGMTSSLTQTYTNKLLNIKYKANICIMMEMSEPLSPFYWVTVAEEDSPFVLVIEHTNLVKDNRYGNHVVYLSRYIDTSDKMFKMSDDRISDIFLEGLKSVFPSWNKSSVLNITVSRARYAQPVIEKNYSSVLPDFRTPSDNVYLACMAQIYPEDRGQNYAIAMGKKIAGIVNRDNRNRSIL